MADEEPQYENQPGKHIAFVEHQITIKSGIDQQGHRGIYCEFLDLTKAPDEDGHHFGIPYFQGKQLLAVAGDQLLIQYGMLHPPTYAQTDDV